MAAQKGDLHHLARFLEAQEADFETALGEIRRGHKNSHWIWYIFPQLDGIAPVPSSNTAFYSIKCADEALAYLAHPVLGVRLKECMEAIIGHPELSTLEIFGAIDAQKVWSCATLFAAVSPSGSVFHMVLESKYGGDADQKTLKLLESNQ